MKIVTWNINGIRTFKTGIKKILDSFDADIICVQETKVTRDLLDEKTAIVDGYNSYFSFSRGRSGYSGVATYCKDSATPFLAEEGLTGLLISHEDAVGCYGNKLQCSSEELLALDNEGRAVITQHHITGAHGPQKLTVINVYCPRADPDKPERKRYKLQFYKLLQSRAEAILTSGSHVIVLGDVNTSHRPIDHCDPEDVDNFEGNPARKWLNHFLFGSQEGESEDEFQDTSDTSSGGMFVDSFRHFHPDRSDAFTCWSTMTGARQTNYGTRIDYIFSSHFLVENVFSGVDIMPEVEGSDHCPVWAKLSCTLLASSKFPPLCTRHMPEFTGRQQKLSRFFAKVPEHKQNACKGSEESLPGSQEAGETRENTNPVVQGNDFIKKRPADKEAETNAQKAKKSKLTKTESKPKVNLLAFFKPKQTLSNPSSPKLNPGPKVTDDTDGESSQTKSPGDVQEDTNVSMVTENPDQRDKKSTPVENSKKEPCFSFWKEVLRGPPPPPLCKAHNEPCVLRTVKKAGPTLGRQFFVCARPQGHASNPQARCNFFAWVDKAK